MPRKKQSKVLSDHRKIGSRFVPPLVDRIGPLLETSWIEVTIPELLWISCLHDAEGLKRGTEYAIKLAKAALEAHPSSKTWFAAATSYSQLSPEEATVIVDSLKSGDCLEAIQQSLAAIQYFYPESPLRFLYSTGDQTVPDEQESLSNLGNQVFNLYDKTSKSATQVQAAAVYIGFVNNRLRVPVDSPIAQFPEIERYPDTELSRMIASTVRALVPMLIPHEEGEFHTDWSEYFWNRGMEIDECRGRQ